MVSGMIQILTSFPCYNFDFPTAQPWIALTPYLYIHRGRFSPSFLKDLLMARRKAVVVLALYIRCVQDVLEK